MIPDEKLLEITALVRQALPHVLSDAGDVEELLLPAPPALPTRELAVFLRLAPARELADEVILTILWHRRAQAARNDLLSRLALTLPLEANLAAWGKEPG